MKETGIVRKTDALGRIVLPSEIRFSLNIDKGDSVIFSAEGTCIAIRKFKPLCAMCGGKKYITSFKGKGICKKCMDKVRS